jgi:hypothetical protein
MCPMCDTYVPSYVSVVVERPSFLEVNSSRKFNQESEKG